VKLAQKLLKKATAGWEFVKSRGFKGFKFHLYDESTRNTDNMIVWSFSAVAQSSLGDEQVKSFLEKLLYITEPMRESPQWLHGDTLCAQASFAPILLQKMEQVTSQGKLAMVNAKLNTTKEIMAENIELALERQENLEGLQQQSDELSGMAKQFKKRAKQVKRYQMTQKAKHGAIIGGLVVGATAVVINAHTAGSRHLLQSNSDGSVWDETKGAWNEGKNAFSKFWGGQCSSEAQCVDHIATCNSSIGECRPVWWLWLIIAVVVASLVLSCVCCICCGICSCIADCLCCCCR